MPIIKMVANTSKQPSGLKNVLNYITRAKGNNEDVYKVSGIGMYTGDSETNFKEMMINKRLHNQVKGRMYVHMVQSFKEGDITPQNAHEIGIELAEDIFNKKGFKCVVATHVDKGHIHNHFVVDNVNFENGKKIEIVANNTKQKNKQLRENQIKLEDIKTTSDLIALNYGIERVKQTKTNSIYNMDKYQGLHNEKSILKQLADDFTQEIKTVFPPIYEIIPPIDYQYKHIIENGKEKKVLSKIKKYNEYISPINYNVYNITNIEDEFGKSNIQLRDINKNGTKINVNLETLYKHYNYPLLDIDYLVAFLFEKNSEKSKDITIDNPFTKEKILEFTKNYKCFEKNFELHNKKIKDDISQKTPSKKDEMEKFLYTEFNSNFQSIKQFITDLILYEKPDGDRYTVKNIQYRILDMPDENATEMIKVIKNFIKINNIDNVNVYNTYRHGTFTNIENTFEEYRKNFNIVNEKTYKKFVDKYEPVKEDKKEKTYISSTWYQPSYSTKNSYYNYKEKEEEEKYKIKEDIKKTTQNQCTYNDDIYDNDYKNIKNKYIEQDTYKHTDEDEFETQNEIEDEIDFEY